MAMPEQAAEGEAGGGAPMAMNADAIRAAFEDFADQFGGEGSGALSAIGSVLRDQFAGGADGSGGGGFAMGAEELTSLAAEALRVQGIEVGEEQLETVRKLTGAFSKMAERAAEDGEGDGAGEGGKGDGAGEGGEGDGAGEGSSPSMA
jgi:hypothetical protein